MGRSTPDISVSGEFIKIRTDEAPPWIHYVLSTSRGLPQKEPGIHLQALNADSPYLNHVDPSRQFDRRAGSKRTFNSSGFVF